MEGHHLLNKQNVALFTLLKCKQAGHLFLVVNCHILFNKNRGDTKLVQILFIMKAIRHIIELYSSPRSPENENIYIVWAGDFNTAPCSPLYNFIKQGSLGDLARFKCSNWTGQYAAGNIHTKLQSSIHRKLSLLSEAFDHQKHGRYLYPEEEPDFVHSIFNLVNSLDLVLEENYFLYKHTPHPIKFQPFSLRSAYAEDYHARYHSSYYMPTSAGEILFSTIPPQDPYPFTVDYVL